VTTDPADEPHFGLRWILRRPAVLFAIGLAVLLVHIWQRINRVLPERLVVYCAHDSIYSEAILREFERRSGIPVAIRFDTEATKSLGLTELIVREKEMPRCDVFWNNELLGMLDLHERGLLVPYRGSGWERIPPTFKDPQGHWTGFAARLRVLIINTDYVAMPPGLITTERLLSRDGPFNSGEPLPRRLSRFAVAKPLYGTTLTQCTLLVKAWGPKLFASRLSSARESGLCEVPGNAAVKAAVADGICDAGFTDTDDFFDAKDAGKHVAMAPVRLETNETICIPNTTAIIRGSRHQSGARKLVDFLLSAETELALARSKSRQIPLGPVDETQLPPEVRDLRPWAAEAAPLTDLGRARADCLALLKTESTQ
jgi:iron(III) transport system substrate-binding protein